MQPEPSPVSELMRASLLARASRRAMRRMRSQKLVRLQCTRCGPVETKSTGRLKFCPKCGAFLTPMVPKAHTPTKRKLPPRRRVWPVPRFRSDGSQVGNLGKWLSRHNFYAATCSGQYLAMRHAGSGNTVFAKVVMSSTLHPSDWLSGFHFTVDSFKRLIEGLDRLWSVRKKMLVTDLNPEVLTPFGWHAYYGEPNRRAALERCAAGLTIDHVLNVLRWLRSVWSKHPTHKVYLPAVRHDYAWFDQTFGEKAYPHRRKRRELRDRIESECRQAIAQDSTIRSTVGGRIVDRFLIIVA